MSLAFVFPGQGSQSVGMQADLAAHHPIVSDTFGEASGELGFDLWDLVQNGPKERLDQTVNTQPAMLTAGVATWRAWQNAGGTDPNLMAGHSLGEYTALICAGSLNFTDALKLVRRRADIMQKAVPAGEGAMAAVIGLDDDAIEEVCNNASGIGVAEAVNFNSPGQVVVAGHRTAIERLIDIAKEAGARRAIMLPVSVPSHSSLMFQAGESLAEYIDSTDIASPTLKVVCAVDGAAYGDAEDIRQKLKKQVYSPVRWVDTVKYCIDRGVTGVIECGPGKVLTGLNKRIDKSISASCIDSSDALQKSLPGVST